MARLRLFANLREIAGTSDVTIDAETVGGVVDSAVERFGPEFGRGVETARIWINGDPASAEMTVSADDEVVLLPPVSGGAAPAAQAISPTDFVGFVPIGLAVLAFLANLQGQPIWAAFIVLVAGVWAGDVSTMFDQRGRALSALPVVISATGGVLAAHTVGSSGYGIALGVAVVVALGWAIAFPHYREVDSFSPMLLTSLLAALAAASLMLARTPFSPSDSAVDVFLVAVVAGLVLGAVAVRLQHMPLLDPFSVTALAAVVGAVAAAALWDLDLVGYLLLGLGIAVSLVAGRGLSSMLRLGRVSLTELTPGAAAAVDSVVLAAAIYFPLVRIIL